MMELDFTKEELEKLKLYINEKYEAMNQLLVSNCETDIALLSDEVENKVVKIPYGREAVIENLMNTKILYKLFMKNYHKTKHKQTICFRGTNLAEIERLKMEPFIDRIWSATNNEDMQEKYATNWGRPVGVTITVEDDVPLIDVGKILNSKEYEGTILIAPFTKIKKIEENKEINLDNSKYFKYYNITLEKQTLDKLTDMERNGLYNYILENSYSIKRKLEECIKVERENTINFDNIRKMEQLLRKYESAMDEKETDLEYSDADRNADYNDIERVTKELNELKRISTNVFEIRKQNIEFINMWKRNIAVYMIAECREIEELFRDVEYAFNEETSEELEKEEVLSTVSANNNDQRADISKEQDTNDFDQTIVVNINDESDFQDTKVINLKLSEETECKEKSESQEEIENQILEENDTKCEETVDEEIVNKENKETNISEISEIKEENELQKRVKSESKENITTVQKLIDDINNLITKQQNHAKIAGNMGSSYSALNNAFEMRKSAEALKELVEKIDIKVNEKCSKEFDTRVQIDLELISKSCIEISTLLNYLNNPKIAVRNCKVTRFEEMAIIEENELKRGIAEKIREIRGEAELKKLKDDLEIIEEKGTFSRFIGLFTGRNKIDDFMIEQIEYRQMAIRKNLSQKMSLARNYSIHELMAEITMFVNDNEDDELVEDDVNELKSLAGELRRNYIILESKVQSIIEDKEGNNLPYDRRVTKTEIIELETHKFLRKYGYDTPQRNNEEPKYQDTMVSEIGRIIEYINSSNII